MVERRVTKKIPVTVGAGLARTLLATTTARANSMVPFERDTQPAPASPGTQSRVLVVLRFYGEGIWYTKLKQSQKMPSITGGIAGGVMILSTKNALTLSLATFQIGFQHLPVGGLENPEPICSHALMEYTGRASL